MIYKNFLKSKLKKKTVVGTWQTIPSATISEILSLSGLDFLIIDFEHGPINYKIAKDMIRACELHGCSPLIRVKKNDHSLILSALEIGAHGIVVPQIENKNDVKNFINSTYYRPIGNRGVSAFTRSSGYSIKLQKNKKLEDANKNLTNVILVESVNAINNIEEICDNDQIEIIYIGTYDLSQSIGKTGNIYNKELIKIIKKTVKKIIYHNKIPGILAQNISDANFFKKMGFKFILYSVDCALILEKIKMDVDKIR